MNFAPQVVFFQSYFDVQNRRFTTITCKKCKYTEIYKGTTSDLENIFDYLIGG